MKESKDLVIYAASEEERTVKSSNPKHNISSRLDNFEAYLMGVFEGATFGAIWSLVALLIPIVVMHISMTVFVSLILLSMICGAIYGPRTPKSFWLDLRKQN